MGTLAVDSSAIRRSIIALVRTLTLK